MHTGSAAVHSTSKNVAIGEQLPLAARQIIELRAEARTNRPRPGPCSESCIVDNGAVEGFVQRTADKEFATLIYIKNAIQGAARPIQGATVGNG